MTEVVGDTAALYVILVVIIVSSAAYLVYNSMLWLLKQDMCISRSLKWKD